MERRFYRELWEIRFRKMLALEKQGIGEYEALLFECRRANERRAVIPHLERLIKDEKKHAALVEELLEILARQVD